jgi:DNA polymerase-3 subunit epsilon
MNETHERDREAAAQWAARLINRDDVYILDTETSDLNGEILELTIINLQGEPVYNGRFKPSTPIHWKAARVHGLTEEILANEPLWANEYEAIRNVLEGKTILIYNAAFDVPMIRRTCELYQCQPITFKSQCVMLQYAAFVGEWNDYYGNYRWQRLPEGDHSALGDCLATLDILKKMAAAYVEPAKPMEQGRLL